MSIAVYIIVRIFQTKKSQHTSCTIRSMSSVVMPGSIAAATVSMVLRPSRDETRIASISSSLSTTIFASCFASCVILYEKSIHHCAEPVHPTICPTGDEHSRVVRCSLARIDACSRIVILKKIYFHKTPTSGNGRSVPVNRNSGHGLYGASLARFATCTFLCSSQKPLKHSCKKYNL